MVVNLGLIVFTIIANQVKHNENAPQCGIQINFFCHVGGYVVQIVSLRNAVFFNLFQVAEPLEIFFLLAEPKRST